MVLGTTLFVKKGYTKRKWVLIDAKEKVLGRLATQIAWILMGKNNPAYTPHVEMGDFVIVVNAKDVILTGKKSKTKMYDHYTGYPGGRREYNYEQLVQRKPEEGILRAVKGMLPKNRLGDRMITRLRVYPGPQHKHSAQKPVVWEVKT